MLTMSTRGGHRGLLPLLLSLLALCFDLPTRADVSVYVTSSSYSPNPVNISAGEYVVWVCTDNNGPYDIGDQYYAWEAGTIVNNGDYVYLQFTAPGNYSYIDHTFDNGGPGSIHVLANVAPTANITSPTNNSVFTAPATFNFTAVASDTDTDGLLGLRLFLGTNLLSQMQAPSLIPPGRAMAYVPQMTNSTVLSNLDAGTYTLYALSTDTARETVISSPVTITVQNPAGITLTPLAILAGKFQFNVTGLTAGKTNIMQATTNIASSANWVSLATNIASGSTTSFTNAVGAGRRYFRILQLP